MNNQATGINPVFLAHSRLRRRRFDDTIQLCTDLLEKNKLDQQVWFLKVRATTLKNWVDDTELDEEGEILLGLRLRLVDGAVFPVQWHCSRANSTGF